MVIEWWDSGRANTRSDLEERYSAWKQTRSSPPRPWTDVAGADRNPLIRDLSDSRELKAYRALLALGIAALPHAIERIEQGGATDLWDAVDYWTNGQITVDFTTETSGNGDKKKFARSWWEKHKDYWLLPPIIDNSERVKDKSGK